MYELNVTTMYIYMYMNIVVTFKLSDYICDINNVIIFSKPIRRRSQSKS